MRADDEIMPVCRVCGRPIADGDNIVEEDSQERDEPVFLRHRACDEETGGEGEG